jgi:hypothetical protein
MLAIAVTLVPLPLAAADRVAAPPAQAAQPFRTSIAKHAAREVLVSASAKPAPQNAARPRSATRQQSNNPQGGSFFKSPAGIACLAVIALGTGYALYSASNDRIHSVAREGQK